jgi:hypothetical protein
MKCFVPVYSPVIHHVLNLRLLNNGNIKDCDTVHISSELHLSQVIGLQVTAINLQMVQLGHINIHYWRRIKKNKVTRGKRDLHHI